MGLSGPLILFFNFRENMLILYIMNSLSDHFERAPQLRLATLCIAPATRKAAALYLPRERQSANHGAVMSCVVII